MNRDDQQTGTPGDNPNQSLDYDSWVSSIQDGFFQATPMTSRIMHNSTFPSSGSQGIHGSSGLNLPHLGNDIAMDMFNSPERFYRDIINESPVLARTPPIGRTPLRNVNMNMNFSTPNFLKNIEAPFGKSTSFTPLKNQLFISNDLFQTPEDPNKENNSANLNSSPTTIKMNSSAVKDDEQPPNVSKILAPSPTPGSMMSDYKPHGIQANVPKMGCFKKNAEKPPPRVTPRHSNFQIIMTDVNTFANNTKPSKVRKKKLARSSTTTNVTTSKTISKKSTSLKRTLSQPQANLTKSDSSVEKMVEADIRQQLTSDNVFEQRPGEKYD